MVRGPPCAAIPPHSPPGSCDRREENPGNSLVRGEPGPGGPRLKLASALKVSWGKHNGMLSFYWKINENEWK